jgi:hypothetical protein
MHRRDLLTLSLLAVVGASIFGCAGSRGDVRFDSLEYPASMSGYLHGANGRSVSPKSLQVVGEFKENARLYGVGFSWVPITKTVDVSTAMNREIAAAGGEGVINLKVSSDGCMMNYMPVLSLLPFWPGCADVTIEGQIVKQKVGRRGMRRASR